MRATFADGGFILNRITSGGGMYYAIEATHHRRSCARRDWARSLRRPPRTSPPRWLRPAYGLRVSVSLTRSQSHYRLPHNKIRPVFARGLPSIADLLRNCRMPLDPLTDVTSDNVRLPRL